ncbi:zinc finger protein 367-like [Antedon mediterranea]|uniref:zinc finger protein 367-like n=1 Tax=Antedon mediterranea TaxID=105859 RepID=UPI003AF4E914
MSSVLTNSPRKNMPNNLMTSPVRQFRLDSIPKSPGFGEFYPWKWSENAENIQLSPTSSSSCYSPSGSEGCRTPKARGRPKAETIPSLQLEGSFSPSSIRCKICYRVFPREKSLQAHLRTHTGERPYTCDYPGCTKAFVQSGQLKTHQRLHTGEKPFKCKDKECTNRFTHANRHCSLHPKAGIIRVEQQDDLTDGVVKNDENDEAVALWLQRFVSASKTPSKVTKSEKRKFEMKVEGDERKRSRITARRRLEEQREKFHCAVALVELAEKLPCDL